MTWYKYPRTFHLPWSPGGTSDDRRLKDTSHLRGREVVVTEKMDGECTTLYRNHSHARSTESIGHESRNWVRALHGSLAHEIPDGWRVCGENLYAKHSIHYHNLPSYFLVFGVYNAANVCLSWDETTEWCKLLNLVPVPELYRGPWRDDLNHWTGVSVFGGPSEGYVVRLAGSFRYEDHALSTAKFVRKSHVQTDEHWLRQPLFPNGLMEDLCGK